MEIVLGVFSLVIMFGIIACAVKAGVKEALRDIIKEYDLKEILEKSNKDK